MRLFLVVFSFIWVSVYFDSIYQRRRAERFISELQSFPFATASFVEVRDLTIRNGGRPLQTLPQTVPFTCTVRDCTFEVWIKHRLLRLPLEGRVAELVYSAFPYVGIRPWVVYARFDVAGGKLARSNTQIGQLRRGRLDSFEGLLPILYEVDTSLPSNPRIPTGDPSAAYGVGPPAGYTGPAEELWMAQVLQLPEATMRRVFDVDLHCFTAIFRGCTGFRELAPSAWADREARLAKFRNEEERKRRN